VMLVNKGKGEDSLEKYGGTGAGNSSTSTSSSSGVCLLNTAQDGLWSQVCGIGM